MSIKKEIDIFFQKRNYLIDQLDVGKIGKEQFIQQNLQLIYQISMKPFSKVLSYEEGMYNYQYYNTMAKHYNTIANEYKFERSKKKKYQEAYNKCRNYYYEKDRTLEQMLILKKFENMVAYYVSMYSTRLKDQLFEIVFLDEEKAVFHTMNPQILSLLKKNEVFIDEIRESVINEYINTKY